MREIGRNLHNQSSVVFESISHNNIMLNGLNSLRQDGLLLDVSLLVDGKTFEAHRVVLASTSAYFRAMFTDNMRESQEAVIKLQDVTAEGISALINYAYTSRITLNLNNIQDILSAANFLQFVDVVQTCSNYLDQQLDIDNCVDVATIAETYSLEYLKKRVFSFMCSNLLKFSRSQGFPNLSFAQLDNLLKSEFPVDCSESNVLSVIIKWIQCSVNERIHCLYPLMKRVHFDEISAGQLDVQYSPLKSLLAKLSTKNNHLCRTLLSACGKYHSHPSDQNTNALVNTRGMELAIVKIGGFTAISGVTNEITYYLPSAKKWKCLTSVPHVDQCNSGVTVYNNELYIVGGCFNQSLQENIHPFGFRYNPITDSWANIAPMQRERCRFSLSMVANYIYAIGGVGELDPIEEDETASSEMYDPLNDMWSAIAPCPGGCRTQHAAAVWRNCIFISGGLDQDMVLESMTMYNTVHGEWELKSAMQRPRADHSMVCYRDKLYVCGGWNEGEVRGLVDTIDCYDIETDSWSVIATVPTPRYHCGSVINGSRLYIIGGFHSDNTFDRCTSVIEYFDLETGAWSRAHDYPQDVWEHSCLTLFVPKYRDDMEVLSDKEK